jgi:hypothetical protein
VESVQCCCSVKSLNGLNHLHKAGAGHSGGKQKLVGARGKDIILEVSLLSVPCAHSRCLWSYHPLPLLLSTNYLLLALLYNDYMPASL